MQGCLSIHAQRVSEHLNCKAQLLPTIKIEGVPQGQHLSGGLYKITALKTVATSLCEHLRVSCTHVCNSATGSAVVLMDSEGIILYDKNSVKLLAK